MLLCWSTLYYLLSWMILCTFYSLSKKAEECNTLPHVKINFLLFPDCTCFIQFLGPYKDYFYITWPNIISISQVMCIDIDI